MVPICRHCGEHKVNRPRGLCWGCFYSPGVKDLYPSTSKFARKGELTENRELPLPTEPTPAAPGTPEKLEVMALRVQLKQSLWHPLDAGGCERTQAMAG